MLSKPTREVPIRGRSSVLHSVSRAGALLIFSQIIPTPEEKSLCSIQICRGLYNGTAATSSQPALGAVAVPAPRDSAILDQSVVVTSLRQGVPTKRAVFSGIWAGRLEGMYEGKLRWKVTVTYAWGDLADNRPGVADGAGRIVGSTLRSSACRMGRTPALRSCPMDSSDFNPNPNSA